MSMCRGQALLARRAARHMTAVTDIWQQLTKPVAPSPPAVVSSNLSVLPLSASSPTLSPTPLPLSSPSTLPASLPVTTITTSPIDSSITPATLTPVVSIASASVSTPPTPTTTTVKDSDEQRDNWRHITLRESLSRQLYSVYDIRNEIPMEPLHPHVSTLFAIIDAELQHYTRVANIMTNSPTSSSSSTPAAAPATNTSVPAAPSTTAPSSQQHAAGSSKPTQIEPFTFPISLPSYDVRHRDPTVISSTLSLLVTWFTRGVPLRGQTLELQQRLYRLVNDVLVIGQRIVELCDRFRTFINASSSTTPVFIGATAAVRPPIEYMSALTEYFMPNATMLLLSSLGRLPPDRESSTWRTCERIFIGSSQESWIGCLLESSQWSDLLTLLANKLYHAPFAKIQLFGEHMVTCWSRHLQSIIGDGSAVFTMIDQARQQQKATNSRVVIHTASIAPLPPLMHHQTLYRIYALLVDAVIVRYNNTEAPSASSNEPTSPKRAPSLQPDQWSTIAAIIRGISIAFTNVISSRVACSLSVLPMFAISGVLLALDGGVGQRAGYVPAPDPDDDHSLNTEMTAAEARADPIGRGGSMVDTRRLASKCLIDMINPLLSSVPAEYTCDLNFIPTSATLEARVACRDRIRRWHQGEGRGVILPPPQPVARLWSFFPFRFAVATALSTHIARYLVHRRVRIEDRNTAVRLMLHTCIDTVDASAFLFIAPTVDDRRRDSSSEYGSTTNTPFDTWQIISTSDNSSRGGNGWITDDGHIQNTHVEYDESVALTAGGLDTKNLTTLSTVTDETRSHLLRHRSLVTSTIQPVLSQATAVALPSCTSDTIRDCIWFLWLRIRYVFDMYDEYKRRGGGNDEKQKGSGSSPRSTSPPGSPVAMLRTLLSAVTAPAATRQSSTTTDSSSLPSQLRPNDVSSSVIPTTPPIIFDDGMNVSQIDNKMIMSLHHRLFLSTCTFIRRVLPSSPILAWHFMSLSPFLSSSSSSPSSSASSSGGIRVSDIPTNVSPYALFADMLSYLEFCRVDTPHFPATLRLLNQLVVSNPPSQPSMMSMNEFKALERQRQRETKEAAAIAVVEEAKKKVRHLTSKTTIPTKTESKATPTATLASTAPAAPAKKPTSPTPTPPKKPLTVKSLVEELSAPARAMVSEAERIVKAERQIEFERMKFVTSIVDGAPIVEHFLRYLIVPNGTFMIPTNKHPSSIDRVPFLPLITLPSLPLHLPALPVLPSQRDADVGTTNGVRTIGAVVSPSPTPQPSSASILQLSRTFFCLGLIEPWLSRVSLADLSSRVLPLTFPYLVHPTKTVNKRAHALLLSACNRLYDSNEDKSSSSDKSSGSEITKPSSQQQGVMDERKQFVRQLMPYYIQLTLQVKCSSFSHHCSVLIIFCALQNYPTIVRFSRVNAAYVTLFNLLHPADPLLLYITHLLCERARELVSEFPRLRCFASHIAD
jgi:hypothetical protein